MEENTVRLAHDMEEEYSDEHTSTIEDDRSIQGERRQQSELYSEIETLNGTVEELEEKIRALQRQLNQRDQLLSDVKREMTDNSDSVQRLKSERRTIETECTSLRSDLVNEQNKNSMLVQQRIKLEQTINDLEDNLLNEKRQLSIATKNNRKFELEIRSIESEREDFEKRRVELENKIKHKDENINSLKEIVEEKSIGLSNMHRRYSDLQSEYENLEQRLDTEKELRLKIERKNTENEIEIRELDENLNKQHCFSQSSFVQESQRMNATHGDITRKREGELEKLRFDMRELSEIHETTITQLKQKHQAAVEEMGKQIDGIYSDKARLDKEVHELGYKLVHAEGVIEQMEKEREKLSALNAQMEANLEESNAQIETLTRRFDEQTAAKKKIDGELRLVNADLEEYRNQISSLLKAKQLLQDHLENARHQLNEEDRAKVALTAELRNAVVELESVKTQLEIELENRGEFEKELVCANNAIEQLRKKYENERFERMREMEETRSKYETRLVEAEDQIEQSANKSVLLQRSKEKLQQEVEELIGTVDKANTTIGNLERKQKRFDRLIEEWKQKCESVSLELAGAQNNAKYMSSEAQKKQDQYMEAQDQIESLRRENRNLSDEVRNLIEQVEENATSVFEFEKMKQRLEKEKGELKLKIDDCMMEKDEYEIRLKGSLNDLDNMKNEYEMALRDLQEDIESTKKNSQRMLEMMQANVEAEVMAKREALTQKENALAACDTIRHELELEQQLVSDLKLQADALHGTVSDLRNQLDDERREHDKTRDLEALASKRNRALIGEVDRLKENALLYEKAIDNLQLELNKVTVARNELVSHLRILENQKAHSDGALARLQVDHEGTLSELHVLEERCTKLSSENNSLNEKLNLEQKHLKELDADMSIMRRELGEAENRAEMAESTAFRNFKATIQNLEDRLLERDNNIQLLNHQVDDANRATGRMERKMREVLTQADVIENQNEKLKELNENLQQKMKVYRKQADSAEQEAAHSLARYKVMADDLLRAEQRLEAAEAMISKYRAASRFNYITRPTDRELSVLSNGDRRSMSRHV